jgi:hypothetical protein
MDGAASTIAGDTATLVGNVSGTTLNLPGAGTTLNLAALNLGGSGGVTLARGGTIALSGVAGTAYTGALGIFASGGNHTITAGVRLAKATKVSVAGASKLTISGMVTGTGTTAGMSKEGTGKLTLQQGFSYLGATQVNGGILELGSGTSVLTLGTGLLDKNIRTIKLAANTQLWFNVSGSAGSKVVFPYLSITGPGALGGIYSMNPNVVITGGSLSGSSVWATNLKLSSKSAAPPTYVNTSTLTVTGVEAAPSLSAATINALQKSAMQAAAPASLVSEHGSFESIGARGHRAQTGRGLDLALPASDDTMTALLNNISQSAEETQVAALDQLNPRVFAEVYSLALNRIQDVQKTISDRLTSLGAAASHGGGASEVLGQSTGADGGWTAWTNTYFSGRTNPAKPQDGDGGSTNSTVGDVTGVERVFGKLTLGFMGGVGTGSTQMNLPASKIASDSWHLGLYMSAPLVGRVFADTLMVYGQGDNDIRRTQNLPVTDALGKTTMRSISGRTRSVNQEWLVQLGVGAQVAEPGSSWSLIPSVRFAYAGVKQDAMTEKMDAFESLGMKTSEKTNGTVLMRSGVEIAKDGHLGRLPLRSSANAAWVHDFCPTSKNLGVRWQGAESAPWAVSTEARSADALRLGASFEVGLGQRRTLRVYGEQEYLNSTKVLRAGATFTIGF